MFGEVSGLCESDYWELKPGKRFLVGALMSVFVRTVWSFESLAALQTFAAVDMNIQECPRCVAGCRVCIFIPLLLDKVAKLFYGNGLRNTFHLHEYPGPQ